jgi:predicted DNA binding protein
VCHLCDKPRCVNPKHLWLGTHAENLADMKAKGRAARGDRSGTARLTPAQVQAIRKLLAAGRCDVADLAQLTNVSVSTIENIKYRKSWRHLDA